MAESQGQSLNIGLQEHYEWLARSSYSVTNPLMAKTPNDRVPMNFVLLFGQSDACKGQLMSVVKPDSFLSKFING